MKIKSLILFAIFSLVLVSCDKDMKWINPDDSKADQSEIRKICEEKRAECGLIEYEYLGKMRKVFCGECENGYDCNNNKCEDIDECTDPSLNNCNNEGSTCANEDGTYSCICKENYSGDDCVPDTRLKDCEGLPENAAWNQASRVEQTWNGSEWAPSNSGTFSEEESQTECRFKCLENYNWNGEKCEPATRTANCSELPAGTDWNTVSEITQTWSGSEWLPPLESTFNELPSTKECRYKCALGYHREDSACVSNRKDVECTGLPEHASWNTVSAITQTWTSANGWQPSNTGVYNETESQSECRFKCQEHYDWNESTSTCVAATQTVNCDPKPENTVWNDNGQDGAVTQEWDGEKWEPSSYPTQYSTATGNCKYICDSTHTLEGDSCINQKTVSCTGLPAEHANWNTVSTITQTWTSTNGWQPSATGIYDETASTEECRFKCDSTHYWYNSECTNPCDYEPCDEVANSTKICTASAWNEYSCGCENGYFWDGSTCKKYLSLGNICTGQNKCYNNSEEITCQTSSSDDFFGQDAQYASHGICTAQSLTASSNVVVDNNTGLTWEKTLSSDTYTWYNRAAHCNELNSSNYGGKSNWRVPNLLELLTIIDISNNQPATNSNFTGMPTSNNTYLWTDNGYKGNNSYAYFINPYLGFNLYNEEKTNTNKVLCVSGDELVPATSSDFTTSSDGKTVTDRRTGLMWQKEYATGKTWQQALKYCEDSTYAGNSDWRLPNKNELASLINYGIYNPASDFPDMPSSLFWSSSTYGHGGNAWFASFQYGYVDYGADKTGNLFNARCVRNTGADTGDTGDTVPGDTGDTVPGDTGDTVPGDTGDTVPGDTGDTVPGDTGDTVPGDTGDTVPGDTGDTVPGDTGDAIVVNGGFEEVDENGIPSNWHTANSEGEYPLSSIPTAKISSVTDAAYVKSGAKAVKLTSTKNGNQRFVADGIALEAGNYKCSAYAKGNNYVKIGYCKGSASSCSFNAASHTQLTDEWQQIVHEDISFAADEPTINFVIIVNSKESTDKDGYFDDFVCKKVSE